MPTFVRCYWIGGTVVTFVDALFPGCTRYGSRLLGRLLRLRSAPRYFATDVTVDLRCVYVTAPFTRRTLALRDSRLHLVTMGDLPRRWDVVVIYVVLRCSARLLTLRYLRYDTIGGRYMQPLLTPRLPGRSRLRWLRYDLIVDGTPPRTLRLHSCDCYRCRAGWTDGR